MKQDVNPGDKYTKAKVKRQKYVDAVLCSQCDKKIVAAGPGTGKTHLFKEVLRGKKKTLTLSFVNALVEDLSLELCGISEVKTLHSFAHSELRKARRDVKVFPELSRIIKEDANVLLRKNVDFDALFHDRDDNNDLIEFYKKRRNYYGNHFGYSDIIFEVVKYFEKERNKIPTYEQVVVDEYQDFNKLEVSLIDLLAEKSPVLLAGDDDQALYDFKSASAEHIRQRHGSEFPEYAAFSLPYCSRCTRVIVEATNDIIGAAIQNGYLNSRINKEYRYFEDDKKDYQSNQNPKIVYSQQYARQIPWFIEQCINRIADEVKGKFTVLIISPTKVQSRSITNSLTKKGFRNIESVEIKDSKDAATLFDGLKILLEEPKSNLGWRIVSKASIKDSDFEALLTETNRDGAKDIIGLIGINLKKEVKEILTVLRTIRDDKDVDKGKLNEVLIKIDKDPYGTAKNSLRDEIISYSQHGGFKGVKKIPIKATTIQSSKGLAADYVFITHFDDQYFIKDKHKVKISDQDICNFLVALTRAKKKVFLISSNKNNKPTFLKWINTDRIEILV